MERKILLRTALQLEVRYPFQVGGNGLPRRSGLKPTVHRLQEVRGLGLLWAKSQIVFVHAQEFIGGRSG